MTRRNPTLRVETQYATRRADLPVPAWLGRWAHAAVRQVRGALQAGRPVRLCIRIVAPAESRRLNRSFRGKDKPTNVLSFPASGAESKLAGSLGDVVVCASVVADEAREQGKPLTAHWAHMIVHGTLHLLGHDHVESRSAARMERLEVEILRGFGYQNPYLTRPIP
jgi:probable rRNA maturation factor